VANLVCFRKKEVGGHEQLASMRRQSAIRSFKRQGMQALEDKEDRVAINGGLGNFAAIKGNAITVRFFNQFALVSFGNLSQIQCGKKQDIGEVVHRQCRLIQLLDLIAKAELPIDCTRFKDPCVFQLGSCQVMFNKDGALSNVKQVANLSLLWKLWMLKLPSGAEIKYGLTLVRDVNRISEAVYLKFEHAHISCSRPWIMHVVPNSRSCGIYDCILFKDGHVEVKASTAIPVLEGLGKARTVLEVCAALKG